MAVPEEIQEQVLKEATSATPNFSVDYGNEQFQQVDQAIANREAEIDNTYGGMINNADQYYNDLKDATQQWADKQSQIQQENTDFTIEKIEQEKDKAHKDYLKEQSGAYVDWRKQSNQYGTEAEKMASAGLTGTGFSESSQVSMYNTYQNRVATARESYNNAVLNYNNAIKDAQLQNNAALAEIAFNALQKQLELSLEGFQYKNQLIIEQANKKAELDNTKWNRYQDILNQINTENALKWDVTKYHDNKQWQTEQAELDRNHQLQRDELNRKFETEQAELNRQHDMALLKAKTEEEKKLADYNHKLAMEKLKKQQEYEVAQLDKQLANQKALAAYEKSLNATPITSGNSSGGSYSGKQGTYTGTREKAAASMTPIAHQTKTQSKNYPIDQKSVLALGYGPISASYLNKLVQEGKVEEYVEGGKTKFRKVMKSPFSR